MAIFTNRANRVTGMSGLDTESMVRQIMQAESTRLHRFQRNRTRLEWRQEAYQGVTTRLNAFHRRFLDQVSAATNIRAASTWANFNSTITSNSGVGGAAAPSNAISIIAGANAQAGNYTLNVLEVATRSTVSATSTRTGIDSREAISAVDLERMRTTGLDFNITLTGRTERIQLSGAQIAAALDAPGSDTPLARLQGALQTEVNARFGTTGSGASTQNRVNVGLSANGGLRFTAGESQTLTISENRSVGVPDPPTITGTGFASSTATTAQVNNAFLRDLLGLTPGTDAIPDNQWPASRELAFNVTVGTGTSATSKTVTVDIGRDALSNRNAQGVISQINQAMAQAGVHGASFAFDPTTGGGEVRLVNSGITREELTFSSAGGTDCLFTVLRIPSGNHTLPKTSSLSMLGLQNGDSNHFGANDRLGDVFSTQLAGSSAGTPPINGAFEFDINGTSFLLLDRDRPTTAAEMTALRDDLYASGFARTTPLMFANDSIRGGANTFESIINSANTGVNLSYNSLNQTFMLQSAREGESSAFTLDGAATALFAELIDLTAWPAGVEAIAPGYNNLSLGIRVSNGTDARFMYSVNGGPATEVRRESNTFTQDGITFTLNPGAEGQTINVNLTRDTTATLNFIRDFVEAYNELRNSINDMIHERRARSMGSFFEPLTDEERRGMSEREIEQWEAQARTGLMRRNNALTQIVNQMRSDLFNGVILADGSRISLDQIGITPSNSHQDRGALVIDEARLKAALETQGGRIAEMFTARPDTNQAIHGSAGHGDRRIGDSPVGLGERLNALIINATGVTLGDRGTLTDRAGGNARTDSTNDLAELIRREDTRIANTTRLLQRREEALYRMFGRLEVALAQSDSQMNFMMQMFWQG